MGARSLNVSAVATLSALMCGYAGSPSNWIIVLAATSGKIRKNQGNWEMNGNRKLECPFSSPTVVSMTGIANCLQLKYNITDSWIQHFERDASSRG